MPVIWQFENDYLIIFEENLYFENGMKKKSRIVAVIISLFFLVGIALYYPKLDVITGFAAKNAASAIFLTTRSLESIKSGDVGFFPINLASIEVDQKEKSVTSSLFGLKERKAVFREGLGSVVIGTKNLEDSNLLVPNRFQNKTNRPFPYGDLEQKDSVLSEVDYENLQQVVDGLFDKDGEEDKKTRTLVVVYKDQIISEKYADGFDKDTPMHGWSMTKSIASTIYGVLQTQGKIDIHSTTGLEQWQNDDRKNITYSNLLQMNSGLEWVESYFSPLSDATPMLYLAEDMGASQIDKPLAGEPNESWYYSSGTTNLLSGPLLKAKFKDQQEYLDFWYRELLDKIGMHSAIVETDLSGTYIGSSYAFANTRDWAKFGLLYLKQGNWNGEQILDSSWVKYASSPTNTSEGRYGAQFWLNAGGHFPDAPKDMYSCNGFQGQYVFIIPSRDLVIVRTGLIKEPKFDVNGMIRDIISCIDN